MRLLFIVGPALLFAGMAVGQGDDRPDPRDPRAKVRPVEYRSAFEGYRPYAEPDLRDWRKSNEEVGAAGGHLGYPQPDKPGSAGAAAERSEGAPSRQGHEGHK